MKRWIWEQNEYPNFTYDLNKLENILQKISLEQGYLIAMTKMMNEDNILKSQFEALESEAISTSAIEGEILNRDSVKSSIKRKLGIENIDNKKIDTSTDYLIDVLIDANTNYNDDLTLQRTFGWHNALFQKGYSGLTKINVADFRGEESMEIVAGRYGFEKVYYVSPPRGILENEMDRFLDWFNSTEPSLIKAAVSHLWFVVIHPLDDGNGRIYGTIKNRKLKDI